MLSTFEQQTLLSDFSKNIWTQILLCWLIIHCSTISVAASNLSNEKDSSQVSFINDFENRLEKINSDKSKLDTILYYIQAYSETDNNKTLLLSQLGIQNAKAFGLDSYISEFYTKTGIAHAKNAVNDSALHYINHAIEILLAEDKQQKLANAYYWRAFVEMNQGNYQESFVSDMDALKIYESLNDERGQGKIHQKLSDVMFYLERYEEGIKYGKKAEEILLKIGDDGLLADAYMSISTNYLGVGNYEKALACTKNALTLVEKQDAAPITIALLNNSLGNTYKHLKRYDESIAAYRKSNDIVTKLNHANGMSATLANISDVYMRKGDFETALRYQLQSYDLMMKHGFGMNRLENIGNLSTIYKELNQYEKALEFKEMYQIIRDSTLSAEKDEITKELAAKYETEKKVELISLQQEKLSRQRLVQFLGLGFVALLTGLLILLFRNFKLKQKSNAKLAIANNQLEVKNKENELLLKEIHHRVKNNLQTISSLLSLQSRTISDKTALDAVQESKNRVASMAMIHQKLYQRDNLAAIEMRDYFETIGKAIINSFGEKAKHISLDIQMSELELDVDTAVPIGLIVNELITNSIKHAFPKQQAGKISIVLSKEAEIIKLKIADNGQGKSKVDKASKNDGFGTLLVNLLTAQLGGTLEKSTDQGTSTAIKFSLEEKSVA